MGVALKVADCAKRAAELDGLAKYSAPEILNTRNELVGSIRVACAHLAASALHK